MHSAGGLGAWGVVGEPQPLSHWTRNMEGVVLCDSQGWGIKRILFPVVSVSVSVSLFHVA